MLPATVFIILTILTVMTRVAMAMAAIHHRPHHHRVTISMAMTRVTSIIRMIRVVMATISNSVRAINWFHAVPRLAKACGVMVIATFARWIVAARISNMKLSVAINGSS